MRILVTGASGLLGLNLALEAAKHHTVFGTVNTHAIRTDAFRVIQTDLLAPNAVEQILERTRPDWIIHCAALADVDACESDPDRAEQLNTVLPLKLAELCAQQNTHVARGGARLVHISTDAVFDGAHGDYDEDDETNPLGIYARTKMAAEQVVAQANPDAIIARVNLYGWSLSGKRSLAEFFFNNLNAGVQVMGFTDVYFCPLLVNDLAHILLEMLASNLSGIYHVVGKECTSKYEFGVRLAQQFGLDPDLITPTSVTQANLKAARSPNLTLRADKLSRALGKPLPSLSTGLQRFYTLYQQGYPHYIQGLVAE